ncbi:MAG: futalosine hydrolase [Bacteroidota bacterium]
MNLLLVSATYFEIRPFLDLLPLVEKQSEQLFTFRYKDILIDALIAGIGMVPTAYFLGSRLSQKHYDLALNAGVAGTFKKSIPLGTVVNVVEDRIPEFGAEDGDNFLSVFDLGFYEPDTPPFTNGRLINPESAGKEMINYKALAKLQKVSGITSNTIRGSAASVEKIKRLAPADIESMEGAAFFYACFSSEIPCFQIRSISNLVEERDKSKWDINLALKNLNKTLWQLITH